VLSACVSSVVIARWSKDLFIYILKVLYTTMDIYQ
jgi:hypothetical protein